MGHGRAPRKLNKLLAEADFDAYVESLCEEHYHQRMGRPSIPPSTYFRMLLVGYFEGIDSQRGIAWRCADSLSLREFLGVPLGEDTPDHSRLPAAPNHTHHKRSETSPTTTVPILTA
ncbi:MAG: transposase [Pirellulales bacterium]|nr:transposase [Pirellulales bacterium]